MSKLPKPIDGAIIFENEFLYVCLANYPIANGHSVVVWKENIADVHLLSRVDYEHLMDVVDQTRNALIQTLDIEKVYLIYMDEIKHVHWHLVPRYNEQGFNVLNHESSLLTDISIVKNIQQNWQPLK